MQTKRGARFRFTMSTASALLLLLLLVAVDSSERHRLVFASLPRSGTTQGAGHPPPGGNEVVMVGEGQDAVLECEAMGSPGPSIHWLGPRGERISQGTRASHSLDYEPGGLERGVVNDLEGGASLQISATKSRLFIACAGPQDVGAYTCVADTPTRRIAANHRLVVDTSAGSKIKRLFPFKHLSKETHAKSGKRGMSGSHGCLTDDQASGARIYTWTQQRLELEGNDVQLICRAEGRPSPRMTWIDRDDKEITAADKQYELLENGDLLIKRISWRNMGLYRCVAQNEAGSEQVSAFLYPTAAESNNPKSSPGLPAHSDYAPPLALDRAH